MRILTCPHCGFSKKIPAAKIPTGMPRVNCPKCRLQFPLEPLTQPEPEQPELTKEVTITC